MSRPILCQPGLCGGEPHLEGTNRSCGSLVSDLQGLAFVEAMITGGELSCGDLLAVAEYCSARRCLQDEPENFCAGCSLDTREEEDADRADLWVEAKMLASQITDYIQFSGDSPH